MKSWISLATQEMQIKTQKWHYNTLMRITKMKKTDNIKVHKDAEQPGTFILCCKGRKKRECKSGITTQVSNTIGVIC